MTIALQRRHQLSTVAQLRKLARQVLPLFCALLLLPSAVFASGSAGFTFEIHGYYLIDFAVFIGIIVYFGRKPIAAALDGRYKTIVAEIDEAKALHEKAQARFDEYKARLGSLEAELAQVIADVQKGTTIECDRILADARVAADRIASEEAARIAQEGKKIREELAAAAVDMALKLSTSQIEQQLDAAAQQRLIERVIGQLDANVIASSVIASSVIASSVTASAATASGQEVQA